MTSDADIFRIEKARFAESYRLQNSPSIASWTFRFLLVAVPISIAIGVLKIPLFHVLLACLAVLLVPLGWRVHQILTGKKS